MRGLPAGRPRPLWGAGRQRSSNAPCAEPSPFRAGRRADLHGGLSPRGAEHALRERPWRDPSRGPAQTAVETTVGLDGEATAQPGGPTNRRPGTARPGSRAQDGLLSLKAPDFSPGDVYRAPSSRSPVRIRTAVDTGFTKILPSPMLPVLAAAATISTTFEAIGSGTTTSILILGMKSIVYSPPRYSSVCPFWRPKPRTSDTVMPTTPMPVSASFTSSSLNGLM